MVSLQINFLILHIAFILLEDCYIVVQYSYTHYTVIEICYSNISI